MQYRVGQVLRHKRYRYRGLIIGWDPCCRAGEEWIAQMGVDRLPGGRSILRHILSTLWARACLIPHAAPQFQHFEHALGTWCLLAGAESPARQPSPALSLTCRAPRAACRRPGPAVLSGAA